MSNHSITMSLTNRNRQISPRRMIRSSLSIVISIFAYNSVERASFQSSWQLTFGLTRSWRYHVRSIEVRSVEYIFNLALPSRLTSFDITKINYDETKIHHHKNPQLPDPGSVSLVRRFPFNKEHILCARIGRLVKHKYK